MKALGELRSRVRFAAAFSIALSSLRGARTELSAASGAAPVPRFKVIALLMFLDFRLQEIMSASWRFQVCANIGCASEAWLRPSSDERRYQHQASEFEVGAQCVRRLCVGNLCVGSALGPAIEG